MMLLPVIVIVLYNMLVAYIDNRSRKILDIEIPPLNIFQYIPFLNTYFNLGPPVWPELDGVFWQYNPYVNCLQLLPVVFTHLHFLKVILIFGLMWNVVVLERMISFSLWIIYYLWSSQLSWIYYIILIITAVLMNGIHLVLVFKILFLPQVQVLRNRFMP